MDTSIGSRTKIPTFGRMFCPLASPPLPLSPLHLILMLPYLDMRRDVREIFRVLPYRKQVMMFGATLRKEMRAMCKKFMTNVGGFYSSFLALADVVPSPSKFSWMVKR